MPGLTPEQRKWIGAAVAIAMADGIFDDSEQQVIEQICTDLELSEEARAEVAEMIRQPPSPLELASWALDVADRVGLYRTALAAARADGQIARNEQALLDVLTAVLKLTPEELAAARSGLPDFPERA